MPVLFLREEHQEVGRIRKGFLKEVTPKMGLKRIRFRYVEMDRLQRQLYFCMKCFPWNCAWLSKAFCKSK